MNLLLLQYNNYYNRIIKKEDNVSDYLSFTFKFVNNVNFNPNDNVNAKQVINWEEEWMPDYCVIVDESNIIVSRWFIMESIRLRGKQYELSLKRDVIADYQDEISESPIFVEKGIINDTTNPLIFNKEGFICNQIKQSETLLKDNSNCPWLVAYLAKGTLGSQTFNGTVTEPLADIPVYETLTTTIENRQYYQYINNDFIVPRSDDLTKYITFYRRGTFQLLHQCGILSSDGSIVYGANYDKDTNLQVTQKPSIFSASLSDAYIDFGLSTIKNALYTAVGYKTQSQLDSINQYNGKIIKDSAGRYFEVKVVTGSYGVDITNISSITHSGLYNIMNTLFNTATSSTQTANDNAFMVTSAVNKYRISITERFDLNATWNAQNTTKVTDSPLYDIICMPFGSVQVIELDSTYITTSKEKSMAIMNSLIQKATSSACFDLQLVPYCPIQDLITQVGQLTIQNINATIPVLQNNNPVDYVFVVKNPTITFDITTRMSIASTNDAINDIKCSNELDAFRLCCPNYNGIFEFNMAMNGGNVQYWNVDMTLKPIMPYIHVNPNFGYMYGKDFDDSRGLVCGGDFSLGFINSAWNVYEIQNKNYQNIFDRQIQNMDTMNAIAKQEAVFQAVVGSVQGSVTGGMTGAMVGGPYGAIAGAVIGGASASAGGIMDVSNLTKRQEEGRSYAVDMYNMNLQNVKALPNSITRTSAITANNKLFPFVEYYSCTDVERNAFKNKIKYDGMTIGIIDKLSNWMNGYFKGQLIRNEVIFDDTHIINEIYNELNKGVYF